MCGTPRYTLVSAAHRATLRRHDDLLAVWAEVVTGNEDQSL